MEDLDLPLKQRPGYGRPRVPASGKIGGDNAKTNTSPMKNKSPAKPPPKGGAQGGGKDDKGKKKSMVGAVNGVAGDEVMVDGVHGPGGDGSPEKKKPVLKAKGSSNDVNRDKEGGDATEVNGAVKMNGVTTVDGDAAMMMSPESL